MVRLLRSLGLSAISSSLGLTQAALLFEGATIVAFNESTEGFDILRDASMLIEDDRVTALTEGPLSSVPSNATRLNATDKIISPGFIDTHHHLWQTAYKTLASNTSLAEYFQRYGEYSQAEQYFTTEDLYVGQLTGALELLYEGTTTVLDHAHASFSDAAVDACFNATLDSGVRTFYAHAIHAIPNNYTWDEQITKLRSLASDPRVEQNDPSSLVSIGLSWDAFYNSPETNISILWNITLSSNLSVVTTHFLGGPFSDTNSPSLLSNHGWLNTSIPAVFSHASFMSYEDADTLRETNQYISTTPESELHFGHNHPHAHLIQDQASLGVDCHFTYSSSMVQQARMWLQTLRWPNYLAALEDWKVPRNNPMSVQQAFYLITRAGGLALRRQDLGVLRLGAKADINIFRTEAPNMIGWSDPIAAIILHSDVGDIEDVLVDGRYVKKGGRLLYPDYADVSQRLMKSADRIQKIWRSTQWAEIGASGLLTEGAAPYGDAEVIDTLRGDGTGYLKI